MTTHFRSLHQSRSIVRAFSSSSPAPARQRSRALSGKKCIITGASRGIGAEIARRFAAEGASCLLVGRNQQLLDGLKEELESSAAGGGHRSLVGDVGKEDFWKGLRGEVCLGQT